LHEIIQTRQLRFSETCLKFSDCQRTWGGIYY